jgi:hypothetical protein
VDLQKAVVAALAIADATSFNSDPQEQSTISVEGTSNANDASSLQHAVASKYGIPHDQIPPQKGASTLPQLIDLVSEVAVEYLKASKASKELDEAMWLETTYRFIPFNSTPYSPVIDPKYWILAAALDSISYLLGIDLVLAKSAMLDQLESRFSVFEFLETAHREYPASMEHYLILSCLVSIKGPKGDEYTRYALEKGFVGAAISDFSNIHAQSFYALIATREDWVDSPTTVIPFWKIESGNSLIDTAIHKASIIAHLSGLWHFSAHWLDLFQAGFSERGVFRLTLVQDGQDTKSKKDASSSSQNSGKKGPKIEVLSDSEDDEMDLEDEDGEVIELTFQGEGFSSIPCPDAEEAASKLQATLYLRQVKGTADSVLRLVLYLPDGGIRLDVECTVNILGRICGAMLLGEERDAEAPGKNLPEDILESLFAQSEPGCTFVAWKDSRVSDINAPEAEAEVTKIVNAVKKDIIPVASSKRQAIRDLIAERYPDPQERYAMIGSASEALSMLRATIGGMQSIWKWTPSTAQEVEHWMSELSQLCSTPEDIASAAQFKIASKPSRGASETEKEYQLRLDALQRFLFALHLIRRGITIRVLLRSDADNAVALVSRVVANNPQKVIDAREALTHPESRAFYIKWSQSLMLTPDSVPYKDIGHNAVLYEILDTINTSIPALHGDNEQNGSNDEEQEEDDESVPLGFSTGLKQKSNRKRSQSSSISTVTALAIAGAAIAVVSAGAYFLGRWFANKKQRK